MEQADDFRGKGFVFFKNITLPAKQDQTNVK
jgi:hypothetical protein